VLMYADNPDLLGDYLFYFGPELANCPYVEFRHVRSTRSAMTQQCGHILAFSFLVGLNWPEQALFVSI